MVHLRGKNLDKRVELGEAETSVELEGEGEVESGKLSVCVSSIYSARTRSPCKTCPWCFASCRPTLEMNILVMSWTVSDRLSWLCRWMSLMAAPGVSVRKRSPGL